MSNAHRRMVVQKYSNRPPFDLKKKEAMNKRHKKSFQHVEQSFRTIMDHLNAMQSECDMDILINSEDSKSLKITPKLKKNLGPKIIESFRKATPKRLPFRNSKRLQGRNVSTMRNLTKLEAPQVETLYKNKNLEFGKNIPDHKIMKDLLHDLNPSNGQLYPDIRIDKSTSTTGIIWPIPKEHCYVAEKTRNVPKTKSRIPTKRTKKEKISTHLEMNTEKGNMNINPVNIRSYTNSKSTVCEKPTATFVVEDSSTRKEKSFVKTQVEKLNKIISKRTKRYNAKHKQPLKAKNSSKNYLIMMNSVKNGLPKLNSKTEISSSGHCEWSNSTENGWTQQDEPKNIKFPRETKDAVEQMIQHSRKFLRTPLARYLKHRESLTIKPAIPVNVSKKSDPFPIIKPMNLYSSTTEYGTIGDYYGTSTQVTKAISRKSSRKVSIGSKVPG